MKTKTQTNRQGRNIINISKLMFALLLTAFGCMQATGTKAQTISTIAGTGISGYTGDGGAATAARIDYPIGVVVDGSRNIYITDGGDGVIREISSGIISTVVGTGTVGCSGDGGPSTAATLAIPSGLAIDGNLLYIADPACVVVRKAVLGGNISRYAGNGSSGYTGDGGPATAATLSEPDDVALGGGNLYIADAANNVIRVVNLISDTIYTFAGNGTSGYSGDGNPATTAELSHPTGVAFDGYGNVFIADNGNNCIRKVDASGYISTIAGTGMAGYTGDGGAATAATLYQPYHIVVDGSGNIYFSDNGNNVIRKINGSGTISTVAGTGTGGYTDRKSV